MFSILSESQAIKYSIEKTCLIYGCAMWCHECMRSVNVPGQSTNFLSIKLRLPMWLLHALLLCFISLIFKGFLNMISIVSTCLRMKLVACIDYKNETSLLRLVVQVDCLLEILRIFCIPSISRPWASCQLWNRYY